MEEPKQEVPVEDSLVSNEDVERVRDDMEELDDFYGPKLQVHLGTGPKIFIVFLLCLFGLSFLILTLSYTGPGRKILQTVNLNLF